VEEKHRLEGKMFRCCYRILFGFVLLSVIFAQTITFVGESNEKVWAQVTAGEFTKKFQLYPYRQIKLPEGNYVLMVGNSLSGSRFKEKVETKQLISKYVKGIPYWFRRTITKEMPIHYYRLSVKKDMDVHYVTPTGQTTDVVERIVMIAGQPVSSKI
jgi:hypothetical protein